jgi:hypothetical protein
MAHLIELTARIVAEHADGTVTPVAPLGSINTRLYELGNMQDTPAPGIRDTTLGNNDFNWRYWI